MKRTTRTEKKKEYAFGEIIQRDGKICVITQCPWISPGLAMLVDISTGLPLLAPPIKGRDKTDDMDDYLWDRDPGEPYSISRDGKTQRLGHISDIDLS